MTQILTVSCKLEVSPAQAEKLDAVLSNFAKCCEFVNRETPGNLTNQIAVQSLIYKAARAYSGLSSQLTILAIRRVCGNRKTAKQKNKPVRKFAATSANYDSRTFTLNESQWQVSLTMMKGREKFPLAIGNYQRHLLTSQKPKSATLVKKRSGDYCLQIQIHSEPPKTKETDKCLGVDLGRRDIAVTSAGHSFSGEQTTKVRAHFSRVRQSVQQKASKGTRSSRRRCRQFLARLSGRERRFQSWQNHTISYRLVQYAKANNQFISLEDLTGIRERTNKKPRSKTERRKSNSWAFYQLRQFLGYKSIKEGVGLVFVNPAYTSQTCHQCLHIHPIKGKSYRNGKNFSCGNCGWRGDADLNGAKNIEQLGRSVNTPGGSSYLRCDLSYDSSGLLKAANSAAGGWQ
ncbi:MAG: transposase [Limnoraphis sp. WC205]|jgi:putative transposase|nr:transposase [Limnoraphis sp. WC205]MCG5059685.1 transposase [Limnoraphis sp. WC205]MCG5061768.1 transposase [Limnoraphis sp. WC205]